jgi:hypothetical protein
MPMSLEDVQTFFGVFRGTTQYLVGFADDDLVCIWGLAPPTLASDQAYLWLYTTPALKGHEFVFVRHSQRAVEEMLKTFSSIIGHCVVGADSSIRWLRWLGAEFGYPSKGLIPFVIRSQIG